MQNLLMREQEIIRFNLLKKRILEVFLQDYPGTHPNFSEWKGLDILYFQEHLRKKVKGNVSEKWFYTYFKQKANKLPRIDMLNLLSEYVGYKSWSHFLNENNLINFNNNEYKKLLIVKNNNDINFNKKNKFKINKYIFSGLLIFFISLFMIIYFFLNQQKKYIIYFQDSETDLPIKNNLEVIITKKNELPEKYFVKNSHFIYYTNADTLEMTVNSNFYKKTKFKYKLKKYQNNKIIQLEPDDYALMLNYYITSTKKIKDKQKNLRKIIANDALIYQVYDNKVYGVEVLNKEQFIGLMTFPTTSLKNYVLIYSVKNDKNEIIKMKFKIKENEK